MDEGISLRVPKEITFTKESLLRYLVLENDCSHKLVFKIRTNNKSAVSINVTHDFINSKSKRQIPVKLLEHHDGIKLQINYAKPTEEMILKNDAKMTNIEKKDIKKCIILINSKDLQPPKQESDQFNTSFRSVAAQEMSQSVQLKTQNKLGKGKNTVSQVLHTVVQHPQEDDDELEEKKKSINSQMNQLNHSIQQKHILVQQLQTKSKAEVKEKSIIHPGVLFAIILGCYFIGGILKQLIT